MPNQIDTDIDFVKSIIPDNYTVTECAATKGSIECKGAPNTGFKNDKGDTDESKFKSFFQWLKDHFGDRFQETYCITCTWYQHFIIYLKTAQ